MPSTSRGPVSRVIFFELNEADRYFLDRFVAAGVLPNFRRALDSGGIVSTRVPGWDPAADKSWRTISPWIVWPSVYSGLPPDSHDLVGFGQDSAPIVGRCVWDVLDENGVSTGILGSLMSFPPRSSGSALYYVPESLANTAECFPAEARPLQEFCVFSARNYSESFGASAVTALRLLLRSRRSGVRSRTVLRTLSQVPAEAVRGPAVVPERAFLHSYLVRDAFLRLYARYRPSFATVHMNHVAYVQHRYWRAAEPDTFADELSVTDERFFASVDDRKRYERQFARWIERAFRYADRFLGEILALADDRTVVLVGTALGQRAMDPVTEIHNPVVRLVRERELFDSIGLRDYTVLHQMNPDVTVSLRDVGSAEDAERRLSGLYVTGVGELFTVHRRGAQVFCELNMPKRAAGGRAVTVMHRDLHVRVDLSRHIDEHRTADQSTAHHRDEGWLLACSNSVRLRALFDEIRVTDVAPTILSFFGLPPAPWMPTDARIAFTAEG